MVFECEEAASFGVASSFECYKKTDDNFCCHRRNNMIEKISLFCFLLERRNGLFWHTCNDHRNIVHEHVHGDG